MSLRLGILMEVHAPVRGNHFNQVRVGGRWVSHYAPGSVRQRRLQAIALSILTGPTFVQGIERTVKLAMDRYYPPASPAKEDKP